MAEGHTCFKMPVFAVLNLAKIAVDEAENLFEKGAEIMLISLGTGLNALLSHDQQANLAAEIKEADVNVVASEIQGNCLHDSSLAKQLAKKLILLAMDT